MADRLAARRGQPARLRHSLGAADQRSAGGLRRPAGAGRLRQLLRPHRPRLRGDRDRHRHRGRRARPRAERHHARAGARRLERSRLDHHRAALREQQLDRPQPPAPVARPRGRHPRRPDRPRHPDVRTGGVEHTLVPASRSRARPRRTGRAPAPPRRSPISSIPIRTLPTPGRSSAPERAPRTPPTPAPPTSSTPCSSASASS